MNNTVLFPIMLLAAVLLAAGCTGIGGGQATPAPTTIVPTSAPTLEIPATAVPTATTAGGSLKPEPTETIPVSESVSVAVEKAGTYSTTIIAHFNGGKGLNFVSKIDVRVTRPDGSVVTGLLKPAMGEIVELEGTNGTDRAEVIVTMKSGKVYRIFDQLMPYKNRY